MGNTEQVRNQITEGVIWKQLLVFFFPIMIGTFFQQLYNTVDTVVVGQFVGTNALASVGGSSSQMINLVVGFFTGLSSGASVIIAQYYGAKDEKFVRKGIHNAYAITVAGGIVLSIVGVILAPTVIRMMNTPADIVQDSTLYLRVYFSGLLFTFVYNMGSSIIRAVGDSRTPLYVLIACCILNIILDLLFVVVFKEGVLGVALATLIAQAFSAFLVTWKLMRSEGMLHLKLSKIRFYKSALISQIKLGIPTGIEAILFAITNIAIQTALNSFGTDTTAAWSAYGKLDAIFWMINTAFGISITTFVGQNYGAGKIDRVKKSVKVCMGMELVTATVMIIFLIIAREFLFRMFTSDANVIRIGSEMLVLITPWYIVYVFIEILAGALRGIGDVIIPVFITLGGICVLRIIWLVAALKISPTISVIIFSYPVTWILTALIFIVYYYYKHKKTGII